MRIQAHNVDFSEGIGEVRGDGYWPPIRKLATEDNTINNYENTNPIDFVLLQGIEIIRLTNK